MSRGRSIWSVARSQGKRLFVWLLALVIVFTTLFVVYFGMPLEGSIAAVERDDSVSLEKERGGYVLEPAHGESETAVVFYPGGRVDPNAYVESLAPLAREANVTVIIPRMGLNLAVVDYGAASVSPWPHAATATMNRYPEIDHWYVGGHSLGGAMACRYARSHPDAVEGLVLYASYCDKDISESGLAVLSVIGSEDMVLDRTAYRENLAHLPATATTRELSGLNHSQFGSYTGQPGGEPSTTSFDRAHARLGNVTVSWFQRQSP